MSVNKFLPKIKEINFSIGESSVQREITKRPLQKNWKLSELLETIHSDVYGPTRGKAHKGVEYFITLDVSIHCHMCIH